MADLWVCANPTVMELLRGLLAAGVFSILLVMVLTPPVCPTHLIHPKSCRDKHR